MREEFEAVYESARAWSRARGYAGHDPFDALNSRLFQSTPLRRSRLARLVWHCLPPDSPELPSTPYATARTFWWSLQDAGCMLRDLPACETPGHA